MKPITGTIVIAVIIIPAFVLGGNYAYCRYMCREYMEVKNYEANSLAQSVDYTIIAKWQNSVINLSKNSKMINAAKNPPSSQNAGINELLETVKWVLRADLVYILNTDGIVVSSTKINAGKSLLGRNYSYRPYFTKAIKSKDVITYEAVGTLTGERGLYFSHAVYDAKTASIVGVAVIKTGISDIEKSMQKYKDHVVAITGDGIVFMSNNPQWLYKSVYNIPENKLKAIIDSKQFAGENIDRLPIDIKGDKAVIGNDEYNMIVYDLKFTDLKVMVFAREPEFPTLDYFVVSCISLFVSLILVSAAYMFFLHYVSQKKIKHSLALLQTLLDTIPSPVYYKNISGEFLGCNKAFERLFNMSEGAVKGKKIDDFADEIIRRIDNEKDRELLQKGGEQQYEVNISTGQNKKHEYLFNKAVYRLEDGTTEGVVGVATDLSEIKKAQKDLDESRKRFKAVVDNIGVGISIMSLERKIQYLNKQMHEWFPGINVDEHPLCTSMFKCPLEDNKCRVCPVTKAIEKGQTHQDIMDIMLGGTHKTCRVVSTPIYNRHNEITSIIMLVDDLTDLQKSEEEKNRLKAQLNEAEKLRAVGQLAAGVAHEINNPLGFIKSNLETMKDYCDVLVDFIGKYESCRRAVLAGDVVTAQSISTELESKRDSEDIEFIINDLGNVVNESTDGVLRVHEIVKNLKSFARVDQPEDEGADINECLESALKIAWNELKYKCEVIKEYGELPENVCNTGKLNQVFLNLLINASHAIENKGTVYVRTRSEDTSIIIEIEDTGCGIPEEQRRQIFEPFFTTKGIGVGTGLGLSIVQNIIEEHKGRIEVESELGKGTVFRIYLPVVSGKKHN